MKKPFLTCFSALLYCALLVPSVRADAPKVSLSEKGIVIEQDGMGIFTLDAPILVFDSGRNEKPAFDVSGDQGVANYPGGASVQLEVQGTEVVCRYASAPPDGKALMFAMNIPMAFNQGGKFAVGEGGLKDFPADKDEKFVQTGVGEGKFVLISPGGAGIVIEAPTNWIALQDNRVFGMNHFSWQFLYDLRARAGKDSLTLRFSSREDQLVPNFVAAPVRAWRSYF